MGTEQELAAPEGAAALIEQYFQRGWTDGLPVVPPSQSSVGAMLEAGGVAGGEVVGEVPARNLVVTADKVAINAVMAGCLPDYMPVVLSAVRGLTHPRFNYHGIATSTGGAAVVCIVNGPVAGALEINAEDNAFGPGFRPNSTIGRALRLLMMNALNTRPGKLDRSTLGSPGKLSFCFAENEAASPWEPLHVERGFAPEQSTTTLFASDGVHQTYNQLSAEPESLLYGIADAAANLGARAMTGQPDAVIVFGGEHSRLLGKSGWNKARVKAYLHEHARQSVAEMKRAGRLPGAPEPGDEGEWRHLVDDPEQFVLVCAGGRVGNWSAALTGWGSRQGSRTVTTLIEPA